MPEIMKMTLLGHLALTSVTCTSLGILPQVVASLKEPPAAAIVAGGVLAAAGACAVPASRAFLKQRLPANSGRIGLIWLGLSSLEVACHHFGDNVATPWGRPAKNDFWRTFVISQVALFPTYTLLGIIL